MNKTSLLSILQSRALCCDGAMGTQLLARGMTSGECGMKWNLERAADVAAIHEAYRTAGCDLITTNSFGGTRFALSHHGLTGQVAELNRAAARLARQAAGADAWVLGDVGPFGDFLEPLGDTTPEELLAMFSEQIAALVEGGADAILVETMSDPSEAIVGVQAAKACNASIPVIATYAFQKTASGEFCTMMGASLKETILRALDAGADIVGANCGVKLSFSDYLELARQIVQIAGRIPVILQPNAGSPEIVDGETCYAASPEEMAAVVGPLLETGVRIVGGCCGTSPAHLASMSSKLTA